MATEAVGTIVAFSIAKSNRRNRSFTTGLARTRACFCLIRSPAIAIAAQPPFRPLRLAPVVLDAADAVEDVADKIEEPVKSELTTSRVESALLLRKLPKSVSPFSVPAVHHSLVPRLPSDTWVSRERQRAPLQ